MADPTPSGVENATAGHLSVHIEGQHPADVPFLFERQQSRMVSSTVAAFVYHVGMALLVFFAIRYAPAPSAAGPFVPDRPSDQIIWLSQPGPGGGGGGGGNQMKEPPRKAELPGKDKITVPVDKKSLEAPKVAKVEPNPVEQLNIPAKSLASAQDSLPGAIEAPPGPPSASQGSGSGGGAGTGTGTGIGPGQGSGLGPGSGGGTGGGVYQPGNGVSAPVPLMTPTPQYTSDAMRAKISGIAMVSCVVHTDGVPGECHVVRSLDPTFGLDEKAIEAARKWRFRPGMLMGRPVNVEIIIEMTFTLR